MNKRLTNLKVCVILPVKNSVKAVKKRVFLERFYRETSTHYRCRAERE